MKPDPPARRSRWRWAWLAAAPVLWTTAAVIAFTAVLGSSVACGDACGMEPGWRGDGDAWQWQAQLLFALPAVGALAAAPVIGFRSGSRRAALVLAFAVAILGLGTLLLSIG